MVSESNAAAIPGAEISVAWSELSGKSRQKLSVQTDAEGRYVVQLPFYTGSGSNLLGEDVCKASLTQVNISVSAKGYEPFVSNAAVNNSKVTANYSLKRTAAGRLR